VYTGTPADYDDLITHQGDTIMTNLKTVQAFRQTANEKVQAGVVARQTIADRLTGSNGEGTYRISNLWGCDWVAIGVGELASEFVGPEADAATDEQMVEQVRYRMARLTEALLEGWMDGNSTNPVSNGFQSVEAAAARSFLKLLRSYDAGFTAEGL
jgi:hypothetical protein